MKQKTKTVYYCDHCGKHMLSASSMTRHEKFCRLNPHNRHKCFQWCGHLKRSSELHGEHLETDFTCEKRNMFMYSYIAERRDIVKRMPGMTIRMPLACDDYVDAETEIRKRRDNAF